MSIPLVLGAMFGTTRFLHCSTKKHLTDGEDLLAYWEGVTGFIFLPFNI